jgi:hypothetical protein
VVCKGCFQLIRQWKSGSGAYGFSLRKKIICCEEYRGFITRWKTAKCRATWAQLKKEAIKRLFDLVKENRTCTASDDQRAQGGRSVFNGLPSIAQKIENIRERIANSLQALICQVGIGCFSEGSPFEEWKSDVDPEDYFESTLTTLRNPAQRPS